MTQLLPLLLLLQLLCDYITSCSVAAFFQLIGEEWRGLFSEIRTREFKYVKPDKRLLLDVAQVRGMSHLVFFAWLVLLNSSNRVTSAYLCGMWRRWVVCGLRVAGVFSRSPAATMFISQHMLLLT
jgi:hypothetical protein